LLTTGRVTALALELRKTPEIATDNAVNNRAVDRILRLFKIPILPAFLLFRSNSSRFSGEQYVI
jgi:hypothetical protein